MTKSEAREIIEASLARPSATPSFQEDREEYLERQKAALRLCLIDPIEVRALAGHWAQKYAGQSAETRNLLAIARSGKAWLLYDAVTHKFEKADCEKEGILILLGYSSDDALAEWLG